MKILLAGGRGFIGSALAPFLRSQGHEVTLLNRQNIHHDALEGFDVVISLCGAPIMGRWTLKKKREIEESRVQTTYRLCENLLRVKNPPHTFIGASAIGYYGNTKSAVSEESKPGSTFLATVCQEWEDAASILQRRGVRVLFARFGVVLGKEGGALKKFRRIFKWGVGGKIGNGEQIMSWMALQDVLEALSFLITHQNLFGPFNFVTENPVTNAEFTKILGEVLKRPTYFSIPAPLLKLVLGKEVAEEIFLNSSHVLPKRLRESGYVFQEPLLRNYLINIL